ncbi:hypothetical protein BGZ54_009891 [Gamsiella multidivaricata]|nr:hypothetical protein BGZ54_009891 [Gamsiella multidivaricata]
MRTLLHDLLAELSAECRSVATTLWVMLENLKADEQERPLSKDQEMGSLLESLANGVCDTIRFLNDDKVTAAIKARSEALLQAKPSCQTDLASW